MTDLICATKHLLQENYTCVLCKEDKLYFSRERGIRPLLMWLDSGEDFREFSAADKVIGKAAAFLYVLLGVRHIYATVISKPALAVLESWQITVTYDNLTDFIRNRTDTGFCPMESAVLEIDNAEEALDILRDKQGELAKK